MRYLELSKEGRVKTFKEDFKLVLREKIERRVSRVVPENFLLRCIFYLLRWLFSDDGKVAGWTRNWKCNWILIIDNKVIGSFKERKKLFFLKKNF